MKKGNIHTNQLGMVYNDGAFIGSAEHVDARGAAWQARKPAEFYSQAIDFPVFPTKAAAIDYLLEQKSGEEES